MLSFFVSIKLMSKTIDARINEQYIICKAFDPFECKITFH